MCLLWLLPDVHDQFAESDGRSSFSLDETVQVSGFSIIPLGAMTITYFIYESAETAGDPLTQFSLRLLLGGGLYNSSHNYSLTVSGLGPGPITPGYKLIFF